MSARVLFVDDEQSLLNGIERRLGGELDLVTASSGQRGLAAIDEQGPFAVVVTDMRMPKMDGLQFIKAAQLRSPDTVFVMLTGNQDQRTAIQALNEGHVFRFLTKPCQSQDLKQAVEASLHQYNLVTAEKVLLQQTFYGAISLMTDIMEIIHPAIFSRLGPLQEIVESLRSQLEVEQQWEYMLAARLALVGFALMPDDDRLVPEFGVHSQQDVNDYFVRAAEIGSRLIGRIPRLKTVADIIERQAGVDGSAVIQSPQTDDDKSQMGATLLRVAIHWDCLARQGLPVSVIVDEMRKSLPMLSPDIIRALRVMQPEGNADQSGTEVAPDDLEEGMVFAEDVVTASGAVLIGAGRRVTPAVIERLGCYPTGGVTLRPLYVRRTSISTPADLVLA